MESIGGASGRSSNYGDTPKGDIPASHPAEPSTSMAITPTKHDEIPEEDDNSEMETAQRLHILR